MKPIFKDIISIFKGIIELLILIPLKILELALNIFAFILVALTVPFVMIINAIKSKNNVNR